MVEGTVGRFIFNAGIPQDLRYVNRDEHPYDLEIDTHVNKRVLGDIVDRCFRRHGNIRTSQMLDYIKQIGFKYSTIGALTISMEISSYRRRRKRSWMRPKKRSANMTA